jgi:hypothetical protein
MRPPCPKNHSKRKSGADGVREAHDWESNRRYTVHWSRAG